MVTRNDVAYRCGECGNPFLAPQGARRRLCPSCRTAAKSKAGKAGRAMQLAQPGGVIHER